MRVLEVSVVCVNGGVVVVVVVVVRVLEKTCSLEALSVAFMFSYYKDYSLSIKSTKLLLACHCLKI